jgi:hypothetical protein
MKREIKLTAAVLQLYLLSSILTLTSLVTLGHAYFGRTEVGIMVRLLISFGMYAISLDVLH